MKRKNDSTSAAPSRHRHGGFVATACSALALMVIGLCVAVGIICRNSSREVRSQIGFVVVYNPAEEAAASDLLRSRLIKEPYSWRLISRSAERVLQRWEEMMGPEEMLDINPFLPEIEVTVRPDWASADSLNAIARQLESLSYVDHVEIHPEIASDVTHTLTSIGMILSLIGIAMIIVAAITIIALVRLQTRSESGAIIASITAGTPRKTAVSPYVRRAAFNGLIAGAIASAAMVAVIYYLISLEPAIAPMISLQEMTITAAVLIAAGVTLMAGSARCAAFHYIASHHTAQNSNTENP